MIHICVLPSGLVTISMLMQRSAVWRWLTSLVCMYVEAGQKRTDVEMADLNLGAGEVCASVGAGQRAEMADSILDVCTSVGAGQRAEMADSILDVCTSVGAGQRAEMADSILDVCTSVGAGQRVEMADSILDVCTSVGAGQRAEMADSILDVCTSVGAGQKWDRVEMADLNLEVCASVGAGQRAEMADSILDVCTSVGAGQKWDRVEMADLNSGSLYICGGRTEVGQGGGGWLELWKSVHLWGQRWDRVEVADLSLEVYICGGRTEVGQGGDGWWARLEPGSLMSVGTGQKWDRVETADEPDLNLAVLCLWGQDRSGTGWRRLMSPTWTWQSYVCGDRTEVGQGGDGWWARLEPGSLMSVGTGQKWDRGLGPGPTYMSELYIYIYTPGCTFCSSSGTSKLKTQH